MLDYIPAPTPPGKSNHRELNPLYIEDRPFLYNNQDRWEEEQLFYLAKTPGGASAKLPCFTMFFTGKCTIPNCLYQHNKIELEKHWLSRQDALNQSPYAPRGQNQSRTPGKLNISKPMYTLLTDKITSPEVSIDQVNK